MNMNKWLFKAVVYLMIASLLLSTLLFTLELIAG